MPVRWSFIGSTGSTSQSLNLWIPGSNSTYNFQSNDWLTLMTAVITADSAGQVVVMAASAGQSTAPASTLLLSFGCVDTDTGEWHDETSGAMCGPQGILPSVLGVNGSSTVIFYMSGTGFIEHGPAFSQPWAASLVPNNNSSTGAPN
jgi:hypothetical protein